jgi:predicted esterase
MNHVHRWIPSRSGSTRTIVALHGTGGDETSLIALGQALDPEAAILAPRGNVLEGQMPRFFRRLAEGVFDVEDLIQRTEDLADFIFDSSEKYGFDPAHTLALGYSNGANIAASVLLLRPDALAGAILVRSMVPLDPDTLPNLIGKHILMLTGEYDPILPVENAQRLQSLFRRFGAEVTFELLRAGHELTRRDVEIAEEWLRSGKP